MEVNNSLPTDAILKGSSYSYRIERTLGQGSFGITYLASVKMSGALGTIDANIKVAIKEFFMYKFNGRTGTNVTSGSNGGIYDNYKRKFIREAQNLSKLQHPNIIKVIESFEANNTVYYVMEYIDGGSLDDYILKEDGLKEDEAKMIALQIGSALSYMHSRGMLHLDLKPSNIMRKKSGEIVLIDFGLSKQYTDNGEPESSTSLGLGTPGYAPIEQANYREGNGFPVTMDVYALGATLFKMLTGVRPPEASDILNDGFPFYELQDKNVSDSLSACVAKAMASLKKDRYQSITAFTDSLDNDEETTIDIEEADKNKYSHSDIVKEFHVLPNTSSVTIDYCPKTPFNKGCFNASINSNSVNIWTGGDTSISFPIDKNKYRQFLSDLQDLNLPIKNDETYNPDVFSEDPEKLTISLFDSRGKRYAKYWMGGWKNELGNIAGDIRILYNTIIRITPHLQDFLFRMYEKDYKIRYPDSFSHIPAIIRDSKANPNLQFELFGLSDVGLSKSENEDCFGWADTPNGYVMVVCDGSYSNPMGSVEHVGHVASLVAVQSIVDFFQSDSTKSPKDTIIKSIENARNLLLTKSKERMADLKSTCAIILLNNNKIYWGTVGNSRIYYFSAKNGLIQLTKDQSYVQSLVDVGEITPEEIYLHPYKDKDINLVGGNMRMPYISKEPILPSNDDVILLCSDGLPNALSSKEIARIMASENSSLEGKVRLLKEQALRNQAWKNNDNDNITIAAIRFDQANLNEKQKDNTTNNHFMNLLKKVKLTKIWH